MEDLDPPREQVGAAQAILDSLQHHGLHWDGEVLWQSTRHEAYAQAIDELLSSGLAFRCDCSRARLKAEGGIYRGHCRHRGLGAEVESAIRLQVADGASIRIDDDIQPALLQHIGAEVGDFIIRRRDGLYAYQLAVVVDDAFQGVNRILRGSDLYDSTPRQVYLQRQLGLPAPRYAHIPVIVNAQGQKLSKQTHAAPLAAETAADNLRLALRFLQQASPPRGMDQVDGLLEFAVAHWELSAVPARAGIPERSLY